VIGRELSVESFTNDDEGFKRWLQAHPAGFILHSQTLKLHRLAAMTSNRLSTRKAPGLTDGPRRRWQGGTY
jgi:hypothetical protein